MISVCCICQKEEPKYKCSNCLVPYCCVTCYKDHKSSPDCVKSTHSSNFEQNVCNNTNSRFVTEDTVSKVKLEKLADSESLKQMLKNPYLKDLIKGVDGAPNAEKAVHEAMLQPVFIDFVDECLKVVENS